MIVIDSSFLVGFYNERDAHHETASRLMQDFLGGEWGKGLLLEYVFLEVVTVLLNRRNIDVAARVGNILIEAEELEFIPCSDLFSETFKTFKEQSATKLSFADAAVAYVAQTRAAGRVLTFDDEFRSITGIQVVD